MHGRPRDQRDTHPLVCRPACARSQSGGGDGRARGGGCDVPARRQRARFSPLFFRGADPDSRSERKGGNRRPESGPRPRGLARDLYRALPEGIAFATNAIFDTYAEAGAPPSTVVAVGGGLRNRIWTQATSDASGLKQEARGIGIGASYGDAFLARLALGDISKSAIKQWNPAAFTIEPDPRNARLYEKRYATFRELYPRIRDLMGELGLGSETGMSSAN